MLISIIYVIAYFLSKSKFLINNKIFKLINKKAYDIYLLGDPLNYLILFLVYKLNLGVIYSSNLGTIFMYMVRIFGILCICIVLSKFLEKILKNTKIKKTIFSLWGIIVIISFCSIYINALKNTHPKVEVFDVYLN